MTPAARATLRAALADAGIEPCADSSCMFGSPGGMSTNHGCRCLERAGLDGIPPDARVYIRRLAHACRALASGAVAKPAAVEDVGIGAMPGSKPRDPLLRLHPDDIAAIVAHVLAPKEPS